MYVRKNIYANNLWYNVVVVKKMLKPLKNVIFCILYMTVQMFESGNGSWKFEIWNSIFGYFGVKIWAQIGLKTVFISSSMVFRLPAQGVFQAVFGTGKQLKNSI